MARRVSAAPIRGTSATTSPVAGFVTANVAPESASTYSPPTYARRSISSVTGVLTRAPA